MVWRVEFLPAAEKELSKLDRPVAQRILAFLDTRVHGTGDPRAVDEALTGTQLDSLWKYRVGDHRVICAIDDGPRAGHGRAHRSSKQRVPAAVTRVVCTTAS